MEVKLEKEVGRGREIKMDIVLRWKLWDRMTSEEGINLLHLRPKQVRKGAREGLSGSKVEGKIKAELDSERNRSKL